jgi:periplasmic protein TonB
MPLRCLLFSSNEEMVQPIWQVLADLGIEGEYCPSAVDAVERVTTQMFQIVITDWDDQPEAAFLLKTARDLKAAQRPLTLAIVSDNAGLPEALKAGANSVLMKPIRIEQVRDTMGTACELLRAKQQPGGSLPSATATKQGAPAIAAFAVAAAGAVSIPASVTQSPENAFRAGEFLQSPSSAPGAQFATETECEVQKSLDQAAVAEMDALTDLEPTAAAVEDAPAQEPEPEEQEALTGWASLQARLMKSAPPPPVEDAPAKKNELMAYGETPSAGAPSSPGEGNSSVKTESHPESDSEAALFAYMEGEPVESSSPAKPSKFGRILLMGALAACVVLVAIPRTRQSLKMFYRSAAHAGRGWLNPAPAALPQAVPLHDSFGQSGDEYKMPATANIPDATTDASQIRVLPVIDPTAKPDKNAEANAAAQATASTNIPGDPNQSATSQNEATQSSEPPAKDPVTSSAGETTAAAAPVAVTAVAPAQPSAPAAQPEEPPQRPVAAPPRNLPPARVVSTASNTGIPSSLKSQIAASTTPEASGAMPPEAAMSSIEPVKLTESEAWGLLAQPVDAVYPDSARASGQHGSVVLQVFIGRDGAVQDAKFLQGSLVFARAAIDAVKQWRFKPYAMNGRAVSVQTVITLNFKPPA